MFPCLNILFFSIIVNFFPTVDLKPLQAINIVEVQLKHIKNAANASNFFELTTLLSEHVFELEDGEKVREAFANSELFVTEACFKHPGIVAKIVESDIHFSEVYMRKSHESKTGWIMTHAGFLECLLNVDSDSICFEI